METGEISRPANRARILYVITSPLSLRLLRGQLGYVMRAGFDVTIACSPGKELAEISRHEGVSAQSVPMVRELSLWQDLFSLWALCKLMRQLRPALVNVSTPKAGLLTGLAAWVCRVPCRVYTLWGIRGETTSGPKRLLLMFCERIACRCANRVICVSESLRQKAVAMRLVRRKQTVVLGSGSSNGVDESRFAPNADRLRHAAQLRQRLGIPLEAPVVGFVGRLTRDKGVAEFVEAFSVLRGRFPELRLLLVGDFEKGDPLPQATRRNIESDPRIIKSGFVEDPALYYHVMDVLVFPSRREGFPNAVLEAHAAGKPVVGARSTGVADAVIDGVNGLLVPVGDFEALAGALERLLGDRELAAALGNAGRERVRREFGQQRIWDALVYEYSELLRAKGVLIADQRSQIRRRGRGGECGTFRMNSVAKRVTDIVVSASILLVFSPLMLLIALAIYFTMGRPVLFRQTRPGYKSKPFTLLKFRTMNFAQDGRGILLSDAERLTPIGRRLRRLSLDELPQLWNVLRGEMSLVGPRPLLMQYIDRYTPEQSRRHDVKPGMTGWTQVNGRNALSWEAKFALDLWYIDHCNLFLDFRILLRTFWHVVKQNGISQRGHATMPEYLASERYRP